MKIICITGTPGTGKTTFAKNISDKLGFPVLDVKRFIEEKKLSDAYDRKMKCYVVDIKKLNKEIINEINNIKKSQNPCGVIVDSHLSHYLPMGYVDLCIVTKCNLKVIEKRLKKRKYSQAKIKDNLECEIFNVCLEEAREKKHTILVIETTKAINMSKVIPNIKKTLKLK